MPLLSPRMLTPNLPRHPSKLPHQLLIRALRQRSRQRDLVVVLGAVSFRQIDPDAAGGDLASGVVGHFQVVFLLGQFVALRERHAIVEVFFVHGEEGGGGDFVEGDVVARDGGPDCEGGAGEGGGVGGVAGGEGEGHCFFGYGIS